MNIKLQPCVSCGYCCLTSLVVIVVDPNLGIVEGNLKAINALEERCPHLQGEEPGKYSCNIHHYKWFKDTPCAQHNSNGCRWGRYILEKWKKE